MTRALEGLTVLALEQATTLPFLTYRLVCDGARVIRLENPQRPDPNRFVGRDVLGEPAMRAYFLPNNCGKEAITLNLATAEGRALLPDLVRRLPVDVLATNQRPRSYAALGIDEPTLRAVRRDLIWLGISGFGPDHDEPAYDPVLQARAGFMALTGEADGPPTPFGAPMVDLGAAEHAYGEVMKALYRRAKTGEGARIDVAMFRSAVSWLVAPLPDVLADPLVAPHLVRVRDARTGVTIALPPPPVGEPPSLSFPPRLGEHNARVYGSLGLTAAQIADLEARGIV